MGCPRCLLPHLWLLLCSAHKRWTEVWGQPVPQLCTQPTFPRISLESCLSCLKFTHVMSFCPVSLLSFFSCWAACDFIFQVSGGCPLFRGLRRLPWRRWSSSLGCSAPSLQFPHGIDQTLNCSHLFVNVPDTQSLSHLL